MVLSFSDFFRLRGVLRERWLKGFRFFVCKLAGGDNGQDCHSRERLMKQPAVIQSFSPFLVSFYQCWLASSQNRFWGSCQEKPSWAGRDASSHWWRECGISNVAWKRGSAREDTRCSLNDEWNTANNKRLSMWCAQCSVWLVISWNFMSSIGELCYLRMVEARRDPLKTTERILFWKSMTFGLWMLLASYPFFSSNTHAFPLSLVPKETENNNPRPFKQSKVVMITRYQGYEDNFF